MCPRHKKPYCLWLKTRLYYVGYVWQFSDEPEIYLLLYFSGICLFTTGKCLCKKALRLIQHQWHQKCHCGIAQQEKLAHWKILLKRFYKRLFLCILTQERGQWSLIPKLKTGAQEIPSRRLEEKKRSYPACPQWSYCRVMKPVGLTSLDNFIR